MSRFKNISLLALMADVYGVSGLLQRKERKNKRKLSQCRNATCKNLTDHSGGFCSSDCARGLDK